MIKALALLASRCFSSGASLKQPAPFLPAGAPEISWPAFIILARFLLTVLLKAAVSSLPDFWATNFLMAAAEEPFLSFSSWMAAVTRALVVGTLEPPAPPAFLTEVFLVATFLVTPVFLASVDPDVAAATCSVIIFE